jgi:hypothetical protein
MAALPALLPTVSVWLTLPAGGVAYLALLLALGAFRGNDWKPILDTLPGPFSRYLTRTSRNQPGVFDHQDTK